jgi:hypothetical protein
MTTAGLPQINRPAGCGQCSDLLPFRPMGTSRKNSDGDQPFLDDFLDWMDTPEGQEYIELADLLWPLMSDAQLDASQRKFVWPDGERLSFEDAARCLHAQQPNYALEDVKEFLISWIDNYAPEGMAQERLDELDRLLEDWAGELRESM